MLVEEEEEEEEDDEQNSLLQPHASMTLGTMTIPTYYISTAILVISPLEKTHNEVYSLS